jgi:hypothetical protein
MAGSPRNSFKYRHKSGVLLAGKPDLVVLRDGSVLVIDCKTGRERVSDRVQVMIYMCVLPLCVPELKSRLVYPARVVDIPPEAVEDGFREDLDYFLDFLASDAPPEPAPSTRECLFCDITADDCSSRVALTQVQPSC